jgi:hypothetical protein
MVIAGRWVRSRAGLAASTRSVRQAKAWMMWGWDTVDSTAISIATIIASCSVARSYITWWL